MKDLFSKQPEAYKRYRPSYPSEVFEFVYALVNDKKRAWDVGTGNGQVAVILAETFREVYATDISKKQLEQATRKENIFYRVEAAEKTSFPNHYFDLITIGQAIHWFDFNRFYIEVKRVIKPRGIIAVLGYAMVQTDPTLDKVIEDFYKNVTGPYWDPERKYIDDHYQTIPFPFEEISSPGFIHEMNWNFEHLLGYLGTWSAVQKYIQVNGHDPIELVKPALQTAWGDTTKEKQVRFPILLRIGRVLS